MPNQYTVAKATIDKAPNNKPYKIEAITEFPRSYRNVSPANGRLWAEEGMDLAVKTTNADRRVVADWVLSKDQRRNMPPLSLFVETRSRPIVFAAFVLACAYDVYPNKVVGLKEVHNAYEAMHRTAMDSRCPRVAAWVLGCSLRVASNPAVPRPKANETPMLTVVPPIEAEIPEEFGSKAEVEPTDVSKMQEEIHFLASTVDTLSAQMATLVEVVRSLAETVQTLKARDNVLIYPPNNGGVTLAQLAEVGMEIHLVPTYDQKTGGGVR